MSYIRDQLLNNNLETFETHEADPSDQSSPFVTREELLDMEKKLTRLITMSHQDLCQKIHMSRCCNICRSKPSQAKNKKVASNIHTPLKISMDEMLLFIQDKDYYKRPSPLSARRFKPDLTKYCAHHQGTGHDTESCRNLRQLIEDLISIGELKEFILTSPVNSAKQVNESEATSSKAIHVEKYVPAFISNTDRKEFHHSKRMRHDDQMSSSEP